MSASKLVVSNTGRSVGSATTLLLSRSLSDDDSGDSSSRQRLLRGGVFVQLVSLHKRGELKGSRSFVTTSDYSWIVNSRFRTFKHLVEPD